MILHPYLPPKGFGTAVVGDTENDYLNGDTMTGFTQSESPNTKIKYDIYKEPYKTKPRHDKNLWDSENFSSIDNKLPIYPRRKGYVNFEVMTERPPLNGKNLGAHESRFQSKTYHSPLSNSPKIIFDK